MSRRPTFAVVIPTYNRAERLTRTLETVLAQEEPAAEIIVVDNHSTDDTVRVMGELTRRHAQLRFIRHERNLERAASRNTGMDHATADYVTLLDSDDLMYPRNLRDAADLAQRTGARFFHNLYHSVDDRGRHLRSWPAPALDDPLRALSLGNFLSCIGVFLHRDIYTRYRFDTASVLTGSEDYELWLRIAADHPIGRVDRVNSAIVDHAERTMAAQDLGEAEERVAYLLDRILSDPHLARVYEPYRSRLVAGRKLYLAMVANGNRASGAAALFLGQALRSYPPLALHPPFLRSAQIALLQALLPWRKGG